MNILDIDPIENMLGSTDRPNTQRRYKLSMRKFCDFTKMTTKALIDDANSPTEFMKPLGQRNVTKILDAYKNHLSKQPLAPKSKKLYLTDARTFYLMNYVDVPKTIKFKNTSVEKDNFYIPTRKDIKQFLNHCENRRNIAIVLCQASSGMSRAEICNLTVGQFKAGYDPDTGVAVIKTIRVKTNYEFVTFFSPEASKAVLDYLRVRDTSPKFSRVRAAHHVAKHKVYADSDYLFIKEDLLSDVLTPDGYDDEKRKMKENDLNIMYINGCVKAGIGKAGKYYKVRSHSIRKFFNTMIREHGGSLEFVDFLMGHKVDETHAAYYTPDIEKHKIKYMQYLPHLSILDEIEVHLVESKEYAELKSELKAEKAKNEVERAKNAALEARLAGIEKKVNEFFVHKIDGEDVLERNPDAPISDPDIIDEMSKSPKTGPLQIAAAIKRSKAAQD